ncbi:MAG: T9SS type A sorting domain-containing protein [Bacteroidota bacterium]
MIYFLKTNQLNNQNKPTLFFYLIFILVLSPLLSSAQQSDGNAIKIYSDSSHQNIQIDYEPQGMVYNLLVQVSDSSGRTIFLDNRYKFSGSYQKSFDMKNQKKGIYFVQIIGDDKHINKKIELK